MSTKTTGDILQRATETLETAKLGLRDLVEGRPERRLGGLRNLIVFGRAVTNVLQSSLSGTLIGNLAPTLGRAPNKAFKLTVGFGTRSSTSGRSADGQLHEG